MNITNSVGRIINRYGCHAEVKNGVAAESVRAFFEPLRYNRSKTFDSIRRRGGVVDNYGYLFICTPDTTLVPNVTVIIIENCKYIVKRCETYYVSNQPIYKRAVLSHYGEALEDDYESDRETG